MDDLEHRLRRMEGSRFLVRAEIAIAIAAPLLVGFLYIAMPGGSSPMFPSLVDQLLPWVGVGGVILGFVWMVRLSRPDPEPGERTWRYRAF